MNEIEKALNAQTKPALQTIAKKLNVAKRSTMSKAQLIDVLSKWDEDQVRDILELNWWNRKSLIAKATLVGLPIGLFSLAVTLVQACWLTNDKSNPVQNIEVVVPETNQQQNPVVKLVIPGKYHKHSDGQDYYQNFQPIDFANVELGILRNFGPGTAYKIKANWLDINGNKIATGRLLPMRDLLKGEFAVLKGLPGNIYQNHNRKFVLPGYIEFTYFDDRGNLNSHRQMFQLNNFPNAELQMRTVLYIVDVTDRGVIASQQQLFDESVGHVHIR